MAGSQINFLAHLTQRVRWAIAITWRPLSSSIVRRKLFKKSSPLKVLDQWKPNLVWIITRVSSLKIVSGDAVHQPIWPLLLKIEHMVKLQVLGNNSKTLIISKIWHGVKMISTSRSTYHAILKYIWLPILELLPFLAHLAFRPCELLSSLFIRPSTFHILIFSSETTGPIATKLWWNGPWMALFQNCVRWSRLPTKMATKLKIEKRGDEILIVHCCFNISQNELKFYLQLHGKE
jgi:hypothetical protein